ncbi:Reverse transcriptase domain-containing protein, partial [Aphis craccivora]
MPPRDKQNCLRASGGVCILINNNYPWEEIPITSNLEVVAISITLESKITICNIYIPNQTNFILEDISNIITQLPHPFILLGDFNSHNGIWGSYKTDHRGLIIERLLEQDNNIVLLNNNEPTRINPINGNMSAIDLSFSTPNIAQRLHWK